MKLAVRRPAKRAAIAPRIQRPLLARASAHGRGCSRGVACAAEAAGCFWRHCCANGRFEKAVLRGRPGVRAAKHATFSQRPAETHCSRLAAERAFRICIARGFKRRQSAQTARKSEEKHAPSFGFVKLPWQLARSVSLHHREPHTLPSFPASSTDKVWHSCAPADASQLSLSQDTLSHFLSRFPVQLSLALSDFLPPPSFPLPPLHCARPWNPNAVFSSFSPSVRTYLNTHKRLPASWLTPVLILSPPTSPSSLLLCHLL